MRCVPAPPAARRDPPDLESLEGVRHLASRFPAARVREVSTIRAQDLDLGADPTGRTRVWLALEALQVTGSVKVRGALVAVFANQACGQVVAASKGSHGEAVAYAAAILGVDAKVVMPRGTPRARVDAVARYGAEVVVAPGDRFDDVERTARALAESSGAAFIPAHDDVHIALGNGASLGFEIVRALGRTPDRVLVPSGRSGLATGLTWCFAADRPEEPSRVWCAECEKSGAVKSVPAAAGGEAGIVVVPAAYISAAVHQAYGQVGIQLEEHDAAPLAPVLAGLPEPLCGGDLVVVLAGRDKSPRRVERLVGAPIDDGAI
jgi:threonine dehydratase